MNTCQCKFFQLVVQELAANALWFGVVACFSIDTPTQLMESTDFHLDLHALRF